MTMYNHIISFISIVLLPIYSYFDMKHLKANQTSIQKITSYIKMMLILCTISFIVLISVPQYHFLSNLELKKMSKIITYAPYIYFFIFSFLPLLLLFFPKFRMLVNKEVVTTRLFIFPITRTETLWFILFAIIVSISEELIYRYFLPYYLHKLFPDITLLLLITLSSAIFAIIHYLQGFGGILNQFFVATSLCVIFFSINSLPLIILIHFLLDIKILIIIRFSGIKQ